MRVDNCDSNSVFRRCFFLSIFFVCFFSPFYETAWVTLSDFKGHFRFNSSPKFGKFSTESNLLNSPKTFENFGRFPKAPHSHFGFNSSPKFGKFNTETTC